MNKFVLVALVAVLALAANAEDFCSTCKDMCEDGRKQYNNDFSKVTSDQLVTFMQSECKAKLNGFEASVCVSIVKKHSDAMLAELQNGSDDQTVCHTAGLC